MIKVNQNYLKLPGSYLFSTIAKKVNAYKSEHPNKEVISLGIGDVTRPLTQTVIRALHMAVDDLANLNTFHGYGPDLGYEFLRERIKEVDYKKYGVNVNLDEIFISDGSKSDCGNIEEIFSRDCIIAVSDPVYPVYVDSNAMAGRCGDFDPISGRWSKVIYMPCTKENDFIPQLPKITPDLIYLCSPNNPTGKAMTRETLQSFVDYAIKNKAIILYDAAYEAYISEDNIPHSIYECEGAKECAIEMRSFSKNAGFTGVRLGFTVVPNELYDCDGNSINALWARRHGTKFNGASYIQQRAGEAVYTTQGQHETIQLIQYYMQNATVICNSLKNAGYEVYGGINAPYIWLKTPHNMSSWDFFEKLLKEAQVVGTPGSGFGPSGEGYFRLTAFSSHENTKKAVASLLSMHI